MTEEARYWLLTGDVPTGPATVAEIHAAIAVGTMSWQTKVCRLGETTWVPFIELSGSNPVTTPSMPYASKDPMGSRPEAKSIADEKSHANGSIPATPAESSNGKPQKALPRFVSLLILAAVFLECGYFAVKWLWPLSAREVCERLWTPPQSCSAGRSKSVSLCGW